MHAIRAPREGPDGLAAAVARLRDAGEVVVQAGSGSELGVALTIDRELAWQPEGWTVRPLAGGPAQAAAR